MQKGTDQCVTGVCVCVRARVCDTGPAALVRPVRPWPYRFLSKKNTFMAINTS